MKTTFALALLLLGLPATAAEEPAATDDLVLARVNGEPITLDQLLEEFRGRHGGHVGLLVGEELIREFLDTSIEEHLLIQEGRRLELQQDRRAVEGVLHLERKGRIEALLDDRVRAAAVVTEEQVKEAFDRLGTSYRIRWILVRSRAEAEQARQRILDGASFEAVARDVSVDPSATHGGDPGPFSWGRGPQELERQVFSLEVGRLSDVFSVGHDFALVETVERVEGVEPTDQDELDRRVRKLLRVREEERLQAELIESLRDAAGVKIHDELLTIEAVRAAREAEAEDPLLASVGTDEIRLGEFAAAVDLERWAEMEPGLFSRRARAALDELIDGKLLADEAIRVGAGGRKVDVEISVAKDRAVLMLLLGDLVYADLEPTTDELERFYNENPDRWARSGRYRLQHIVAAERERAEELRLRLLPQGEEGFAAAAREFSLDRETAKRGGIVGWVESDTLPGPISEQLRELAPGGLSEVVEVSAGFVLIRLVEREARTVRPFQEVRAEVERSWTRTARERARTRWVDRLREVSEIEIDETAVQAAIARIDAGTERAVAPRPTVEEESR